MIDTEGGTKNSFLFDVIIIGAGPVGLACGLEAKRYKLSYLIIEKGCLTNSIFNFPKHMTWFSTPELLEIGGIPFTIASEKPTRQDTLIYYRKIVENFKLRLHLFEKILRINPDNQQFEIVSEKAVYHSRFVILATGCFDYPNRLNIPGADLPKVSHYYTEPFPFFRQKVAVLGGKNSAADAALDLYRHGADVTLIHRHAKLGESVKYWVLPNILNRIKEKSIKAFFNAEVTDITNDFIEIKNSATGEIRKLQNDFVFALTGYRPDFDFMRTMGIKIDDTFERAIYNHDTFETNVPGLYISGVVAAGKDRGNVFVEHGREHASKSITDIKRKLSKLRFDAAA